MWQRAVVMPSSKCRCPGGAQTIGLKRVDAAVAIPDVAPYPRAYNRRQTGRRSMRTLVIGLIAVLAAGAGWAQGRGGVGGSIGGATGRGISGRNTNTTNTNKPSL